jgi:GT2 family glycosyltransferase
VADRERPLPGGCAFDTAPELAVVVLAVGAPPELDAALRSLARQSVPLEVVVVNSGGGDPHSALPENDPNVKIISVPHLLWPGAARNAGIRASRAPWVAFMASDHVAKDDWAAARLERHRQGCRAVACAVVNSHPRSLCAWANHLGILVRRLPGVPARDALRYGASYARSLFEEYGYFREDLRIGEDTEFNERLAGPDLPVWAPAVQTIHLNPTGLRQMLKSQFDRGRRTGLYWSPAKRGSLAVRAYRRFVSIARLSGKSVRGFDRCMAIASWPLLFVGVCAYQLGVDAGRRDRAVPGNRGEYGGRFAHRLLRWGSLNRKEP